MTRSKWTAQGSYRGYKIQYNNGRKRRPWRVEVPGQDPNKPGGHAEAATRADCERFIDHVLQQLGEGEAGPG